MIPNEDTESSPLDAFPPYLEPWTRHGKEGVLVEVRNGLEGKFALLFHRGMGQEPLPSSYGLEGSIDKWQESDNIRECKRILMMQD